MSAATYRQRARDVVAYYQGNADEAPLLVRAIQSALEEMARDATIAETQRCVTIARAHGAEQAADAIARRST